MEEWEKKYITKNLVSLINNILCDTVLLASLQTYEVLSEIDVVKIVTAIGRFDQSQTLLDIVKTKVQGYEALIKALISCNQSGAFNILLDGFPHERFFNLKLNLGGSQISLRDLLNETKVASILAKLKKTLPPLSYLNFCLQTNIDQYTLNLLRDTIPSQLDTYKNRYLLRRRIGDTFYNNTLGERTVGKASLNEIMGINIEGLYIYGKQGSGKSALLTKICNILCEKYPERVVSFVFLPAFVQLIGRPLPCIQDDPLDTLKLLSKYISPTLISQFFLLEILKEKNQRIDILLDGIDEISDADIDWVTKFLTAFNKLSFTRIFLAVGAKTVKCIESITTLNGYDIVDLTDNEQDNLLFKIWSYQNPEWDTQRLPDISTYIGSSLRKQLTEIENEICGRPLQCKLLADKFHRVAKIYCEVDSSISIDQNQEASSNLFELYRSFLEKTFGTSTDTVNNLLVNESVCTTTTQSKRFHLWTALTFKYPELAKDYQNYFDNLGHPVNLKTFSTNLLEKSPIFTKESEHFIYTHQTFLDYLVAECISQLFTTNISSSSFAHTLYLNFLKTIFQQIIIPKVSRINYQNVLFAGITQPVFELYVFENESLVYFLDNHFKNQSNFFIVKEIAETFYDMVTSEQINGLLSASLYQNFNGILNLLFEISQSIPKDRLIGYQTYLSESNRFYNLLLTAVEYSDVTVLETYSRLCTHIFDYDVLESCKNLPANSLTTVHLALKSGKPQLTDHLISKLFTDTVPLLRILICNSRRDIYDVLNKKMEMVTLIISKNKNLVANVLPMFSIGVHVELIKCILNIDPQFIGIIDYYGNTVAHLVAKNISCEDYHNFVLFILENSNGSKIFTVKNSHSCTALHEACYSVKGLLPETVKLIITKSNFDLADTDEDGNNILFSAASGCGSLDLLETLVHLGTPYRTKNDKGRNALHVAVVGTNIEAVRYFLSFGDTMDMVDNDKCYPYNLAKNSLRAFQLYPNVYTAKIRDMQEIVQMFIDAGFRGGS